MFRNDRVFVPLKHEKYTMIDNIDFDLVFMNWSINSSGYVTKYGNSMHRIVLERKINKSLESDEVVDHINRNKLDNRRDNLRVMKYNQKTWNLSKPNNGRIPSSMYKGVSKAIDEKKYVAGITLCNKLQRIGSFDNEIDAARAYDEKARELFGEYASTNFKY
jgi:hypothetical protein